MMVLLKEQSFQSRCEKSDQIHQRLMGLEESKRAGIIFCYVSLDYEVNTKRLIDRLLGLDKRVVVPFISKEHGRAGELLASEVRDYFSELETGPFGIWQPKRNFLRPIEPSCLEMAVIPGIAFDHQCHRLGHGKGYFDRFLLKLRQTCPKVGICFDFQRVRQLPHELHDIPMDLVVTNRETIRIKG